MKKLWILIALLSQPFLVINANEPALYKMPDTKIIPIKNSATGDQYELYIKLPENYEKNNKTAYPVIYFTDAVWTIEILSAATAYIMEDAILVGISWQKDINKELKKVGDHASRNRDYTIKPSSDLKIQAKHHLGQADQHLSFIRNDVINFVENNYRTQIENRSYFGYSLGGQFGAYILLTAPDTFKNYIIGSPAISSEKLELSELTANFAKNNKKTHTNVFISYGALETKLGDHTDNFISMLKSTNHENLSLTHAVIEGDHATAFPLTGIRSVTWLSKLLKNKDE